jgi:hypothetical protein
MFNELFNHILVIEKIKFLTKDYPRLEIYQFLYSQVNGNKLIKENNFFNLIRKEQLQKLKENLAGHAEKELRKAGLFDKDSDYNGRIGIAVLELIKVFSSQGHSGFSAGWVKELFNKLANWENLTPLTNDIKEWENVSEFSSTPGELWQNLRDPSCFSNDGGQSYYNVNELVGGGDELVYHKTQDYLKRE